MEEIIFPQHWTRSDRRRHSRKHARKYAYYGTPGQPWGRSAVYPRPAKPRPASTRSGQARVNYKRNQRAAFLSHLVALHVSAELADACDIEQQLRTLHGRIVRRERDRTWLGYVYWLEIPNAPANVATMTPIYCAHDDGTVTVQSIEWRDANGAVINQS